MQLSAVAAAVEVEVVVRLLLLLARVSYCFPHRKPDAQRQFCCSPAKGERYQHKVAFVNDLLRMFRSVGVHKCQQKRNIRGGEACMKYSSQVVLLPLGNTLMQTT